MPNVRRLTIEGANAFDISYRNYSDLIIYKDEDQNLIRSEAGGSDFAVNWSRTGSIPGWPEECILLNGTRFDLRGTTIIDGKEKVGFAKMRQVGRDLLVRTDRETKKLFVP